MIPVSISFSMFFSICCDQGQTVQVMHKLAVHAVGNSVVAHDDLVFCAFACSTSKQIEALYPGSPIPLS